MLIKQCLPLKSINIRLMFAWRFLSVKWRFMSISTKGKLKSSPRFDSHQLASKDSSDQSWAEFCWSLPLEVDCWKPPYELSCLVDCKDFRLNFKQKTLQSNLKSILLREKIGSSIFDRRLRIPYGKSRSDLEAFLVSLPKHRGHYLLYSWFRRPI